MVKEKRYYYVYRKNHHYDFKTYSNQSMLNVFREEGKKRGEVSLHRGIMDLSINPFKTKILLNHIKELNEAKQPFNKDKLEELLVNGKR